MEFFQQINPRTKLFSIANKFIEALKTAKYLPKLTQACIY